MFKYTVVLFAVIACDAAKPGVFAPIAYSVTATSSQVISRNYNGIASAPIAAQFAAKYVASPLVYSDPLAAGPLAYSAPLTAGHLAYSAPLVAAAPLGYAAHYGYGSPLSYVSAP